MKGATEVEQPDARILGLERLVEVRRLAQRFGGLSDLEREILRFRFSLDGGKKATLQEIGDCHGLSRERIRQLQNGALAKLVCTSEGGGG